MLWLYILVVGSAAAWVYTDAKAKGAANPEVWAMLTMADHRPAVVDREAAELRRLDRRMAPLHRAEEGDAQGSGEAGCKGCCGRISRSGLPRRSVLAYAPTGRTRL